MPLQETIKHRLPLYGPLKIKSLQEFLEEAKVYFLESYKSPFPYRVSLENYELIYLLGEGAFGKVILVKSKIFTDSYYAMKALSKAYLVKKGLIPHALNEKRILQSLNSPFSIRLEYFSQDDNHLYFFLPFICGGELFTHLRKLKKFDEDLSRFYGAQVVLGLEYLHNLNLVYRDLKPENLLIDHLGYLKIADMGFAKVVTSRTYTFCGTPDYIAPEIILGQGYGRAVDWWALGVLIFEMIWGHPPFEGKRQTELFDNIIKHNYTIPREFTVEVHDIISKLMHPDVSRRLGNLKGGPQDVKNHRWFRHVDWLKLLNRRTPPPYIPPDAEIVSTKYFPKLKRFTYLRISENDKYEGYFDNF